MFTNVLGKRLTMEHVLHLCWLSSKYDVYAKAVVDDYCEFTHLTACQLYSQDWRGTVAGIASDRRSCILKRLLLFGVEHGEISWDKTPENRVTFGTVSTCFNSFIEDAWTSPAVSFKMGVPQSKHFQGENYEQPSDFFAVGAARGHSPT